MTKLRSTFLVLFLVMAELIFTSCQPGNPTVDMSIITDDAFLTIDKDQSPAVIQQFLDKQLSPLAKYSETVSDESMTAAEIIWSASQTKDYAVNPRVLLTTLAVETFLDWRQIGGFNDYVRAMAANVAQNDDEYVHGQVTLPMADGQVIDFSKSNGATYALARYLSSHYKQPDTLTNGLISWGNLYQDLFHVSPKITHSFAPATTRPFLSLPFNQPKDGFYRVNSFFDHKTPGIFSDPIIVRFDGSTLGGALFSSCWLSVTCYSGHNAIDYDLPTGTPLFAAAAGTVVYRYDPDGGLIIDHGNGYRTLYWHMDKIIVKLGDQVGNRQPIGFSGNRGMSSGPHLHFGLRLTALSKDVDPFGWWGSFTDPWNAPSLWMWMGGLVVDDCSPQSQLFFNKYWYHSSLGYGGQSWFTHSVSTAGASTNWGIWGTTIPQDGEYEVLAYWPKTPTNTTSARYTIYTAGGPVTIKMNQRTDGNRFVSLGKYIFKAGPSLVKLTDLTDDNPKFQDVYFDAVEWRPSGALSNNIYLPDITNQLNPVHTPQAYP